MTKQRPSYQNWDRKWEQGWSWVTRSEQEEQLWPVLSHCDLMLSQLKTDLIGPRLESTDGSLEPSL